MHIERFEIRSPRTNRVFDSGDRPLGRLVLVHGGGAEAESLASEFFGSLLLGLLHSNRRPTTTGDGDVSNRVPGHHSRAGSLQLVTDSGERFQVVRNDSGELIAAGSPPPLPSPHVFRWIHAPRESRQQRWSLESWHEVQRMATGLSREEREALEARTGTRIASLLDPTDSNGIATGRKQSTPAEEQSRFDEPGSPGAESNPLSSTDPVRQLEARRSLVQSQRRAARDGLRRVGRLWPVHFQLRLVERWRTEAGDPSELASLPDRPRDALKELDRRLAELDVEIQTARSAAQESADAASSLRSRDRRLLDRATEIDAVLRRHAVVPDLEREREELELEQRGVTQQLEDLVRTTFADDLDETRLLAIDLESLARRLAELERARSERDAAVEELSRHRRLEPDEPPLFPLAVVVLLAIGVGILAISFEATNMILAAIAYTVIWIAATWSGMWYVRSMRSEEDWADHAERREQLEVERDQRIAEFERHVSDVDTRLEGCPILAELRDTDGPLLVSRLQEARALIHQRRTRDSRATVLQRRIDDARNAVARLTAELLPEHPGVPGTTSEAGDAAALLRRESLEAHRRRGVVERAQRELARWNATVERHEQRRHTAFVARDTLQERLTVLGDGDPAVGALRVEDRVRAFQAAEWLEGRLLQEEPDLGGVQTEIDAARRTQESWVDDEGMVLGLTHLTEELDDELAALDAELTHQRIRVEIARLVDPLRDAEEQKLQEIEQYREELERVSQLVRDAEAHFRECEQPALVERANQLVTKMTGTAGAIEANESGVRLPGSEDDPLVGASLLALRLALSERFEGNPDHGADEGDASTDPGESSSALERLPIFLQEDFAAWPEKLREATWQLLRELSCTRQIFVFAPSPESFGLPATAAPRDDRTVPLGQASLPPSRLEKLGAVFRGRFGPFADRMRAFLSRREPDSVSPSVSERPASPELTRAREILDAALDRTQPDPRARRSDTRVTPESEVHTNDAPANRSSIDVPTGGR